MSDISPAAARAARELRVLISRLRRRLKEVDSAPGLLTPSQLSVLSRLDEGPSTLSQLAAAERVRPQSMAATLAALDEGGWIQRRPDPADGRRQQISLTGATRELVDGSRQNREEWLARALQDRYTDAERDTVTEALTLLERLTHS